MRALRCLILFLICVVSILSRIFSIVKFESIIHEYDPWFNYRATKYLEEYGWKAFINWFDDISWHPLGRAVGDTVFPGLMIVSCMIYKILRLFIDVDIKDVCVFIPVIFSILTVLSSYYLSWEIFNDHISSLISAFFMALIPGYSQRSVAGSYDNEGISIFLLVITFYFWIRTLRTGKVSDSLIAAILYAGMAASWGGYVFIANMIPLHTFILLLIGRYSNELYKSYSIFWIIGTLLMAHIPFIGHRAFLDSEHLPGHAILLLIQLISLLKYLDLFVPRKLIGIFLLLISIIGIGICSIGIQKRNPIVGRLKSLLDSNHSKTTAPIISSVSEHQPTTWATFFLDLHLPLVFLTSGVVQCFHLLNDGSIFLILYAISSAYFAASMVRLVLILAPAVSIIGAYGIGCIYKRFGTNMVASILLATLLLGFAKHSTWVTSNIYSSPTIILSYVDMGKLIIVDDFREGFRWIKDNTEQGSKILAWWDYGYQIAGLAERPTIVDNNTWNTTHIAQVGRIFALPEDRAYEHLIRLGVDYILVISGAFSGHCGDDLNKFLWMARIAENEGLDIWESDYLGPSGYYRLDKGHTSQGMLNSLMYRLSYYRIRDVFGEESAFDRARNIEVEDPSEKFHVLSEAFSSRNFIVRVYKVHKPDPLGRSAKELIEYNNSA